MNQFLSIPPTISLATYLKDVIDDKLCLHLIVTATGDYLPSTMEVHHERDSVGVFPQFRSAFFLTFCLIAH